MSKNTITSNVHNENTRPHEVLPIGRQHADDQAPMGTCVKCDEVGEMNALINPLPNAYGCSVR